MVEPLSVSLRGGPSHGAGRECRKAIWRMLWAEMSDYPRGSTEWKLGIMATSGKFCRRHGIYCPAAGVNPVRRVWMAVAAGTDSIDGSSASYFAIPLPMPGRTARQPDLFAA